MNEHMGRIVSWFALIMVLVQFAVVLLRYVFGLGFIPMQESILFMHSLLFLVGAGYTLLHDGHVRVDIFYGAATRERKALIDCIGVLIFLWPLCAVMTWKGLIYVGASVRVLEGSPEGTFMPFWLLKSMLLVFPLVLSLQGLSMLVRSLFVIRGLEGPAGAGPRRPGARRMTINEYLVCLMFVSVCGILMAGFPVAFSLAGVALLFAGISALIGVFDFAFLGIFPNRVFGNAMTSEILVAVPLFVFMGVMLERSKVAEELLDTMGMLFGAMRGGLGISVCVVGALLAASTGIVGATVVTMGLLSLPTMLRRGYSPSLACGTICASGTLGQIIPPSLVLVVLGDQISDAYQEAQRKLGNFAPDPVSVGDLFAGALLPGLALVGMYILYQIFIAYAETGIVAADSAR